MEKRKVDDLLSEAKGADSDELREIVSEMAGIALKSTTSTEKEKELADAIHAFAEWQFGSYGGREPTTHRVVGRQLWYEVSERVSEITGSTPESPSFGA